MGFKAPLIVLALSQVVPAQAQVDVASRLRISYNNCVLGSAADQWAATKRPNAAAIAEQAFRDCETEERAISSYFASLGSPPSEIEQGITIARTQLKDFIRTGIEHPERLRRK